MLKFLLTLNDSGGGGNTPDFSGLMQQVTIYVNLALGLLIGLIALAAIIKAAVISGKMIAAADDHERRGSLWDGIKWIIIILGVVIVIDGLANIIIQIVKSSVTPINN